MPNNNRTINDLLYDAVKFEEVWFAHAIFLSVQRRMLNLKDNEEKFFDVQLPAQEIDELVKKNVLAIKKTYLFAIKLANHTEFAMYLARDRESVIKMHTALFKEKATVIHDLTNKMFTAISYTDELIGKAKTFFEINEKVVEYPHFVCVMDAKKKQ